MASLNEPRRCVVCGKMYIPAKQRFKGRKCCSIECHEERNRQTSKRLGAERKSAREWSEKAQLIIASEKALGKNLYICERSDRCKYGQHYNQAGLGTCNYITLTGEPRVTLEELRVTGGYPCTCRKFEPR